MLKFICNIEKFNFSAGSKIEEEGGPGGHGTEPTNAFKKPPVDFKITAAHLPSGMNHSHLYKTFIKQIVNNIE